MSDVLTIAAFQQNITWEDPSANRIFIGGSIPFVKGDVDLVVFPEMFTTGFTMNAQDVAETMDGPTMQWMKTVSSKLDCTVTGSVIIEEDGQYFNRLLWISPNGEVDVYDKKFLFTLAKEELTFTPGDKRSVFEVKGWKVLPLICYDLRFPEWARNTIDYDLLIYVANFPAKRSYAWKHLLIARAIENQSYVLGVNRSGRDGIDIDYAGCSMLVDYAGKVVQEIQGKNEWIIQKIEKSPQNIYRRAYPFLKDM